MFVRSANQGKPGTLEGEASSGEIGERDVGQWLKVPRHGYRHPEAEEGVMTLVTFCGEPVLRQELCMNISSPHHCPVEGALVPNFRLRERTMLLTDKRQLGCESGLVGLQVLGHSRSLGQTRTA